MLLSGQRGNSTFEMNDVELLTEYVARGCQDSFSELVRRHINLVYGTATRQVRDPHLAQEISQKVFCALAQNARSIRNPSALTAWLYRTTCQLATLHVRTEHRRLERERVAAAMNVTSNDNQDRWEEVEPVLDQALAALGDTDRLAILLRFFETKPMAEVGAMLGVSEAAAKMRIGRAIEKLRIFFVRRGVTCSAAGLFLLFDRHAGAAAPPLAVETVLQAAAMPSSCQATAPVSGIQNLANAVLRKVPAAACVAAIVAVITVILNRSSSTRPRAASGRPISTAATNAVDSAEQSAEVRADRRSASTFRLTVLDAETALPLKGVRVSASNLGDRLGESFTDGTGACELPRPTAAPNDFYFRLTARLDGYATMDVSWSRFQQNQISDVPAEYVLKMPRGGRMGGLVADDREQPLAGVEVTLHGRSGAAGPPSRERAVLNDWGKESVITDQAGHWAFDHLPPDWDNVHLIVSTPEFLKADYVTDANTEGLVGMTRIRKQDLLDERAVFALHRGIRLSGRVVDESGRPVAGASLVRNFDWHEADARTMSATDGTYEILNATTGPLALTIQAPRFAPKVVHLTVNGPITDSTIVLARGSLLHGRVVDEDGNSIENAALEVARDEKWHREFQWTTRTDADGRFMWDGAPEQPVALEVAKPGFQLNRVSLTAGDIENVVTLKRRIEPGTILVQGRVLDEERGQPIDRFQILVAVGPITFAPPKDGRNGAFSVPINVVSDEAKAASIEIRAEGYEPARLTPTLSSNPIPELTFKLRPASGWSGTVLLPNGEPAVQAEVGISSFARGLILGDRRFLFPEQSIIRRTDASGRFRFEPLPSERPSGRVLVAVHSQGYAEHDAERSANGLRLQLLPWGRIEGVLRSGGEPLANEQVYLMKRHWNPWTIGINLYSGQFAVRTDATGRFAFESVPPGDHQLGRAPYRALDTRLTAQVRPGETTRIQVGGDGQSVTGRIDIPGRDQGFDFSNSTGLLARQQVRPIDLPRVSRKDYPSDEAYEQAAKGNAQACITYWRSAEGLEAWREQRSYGVKFEADGTFHAYDVPPGEYTLRVMLFEARAESKVIEPGLVGMPLSGSVGVPAGAQAKHDEPVNVGIVTLKSE
jgi:RNA polymerase sigma factor (sigma-70 family)